MLRDSQSNRATINNPKEAIQGAERRLKMLDTQNAPLVIHGPQECGKTRNAERLAAKYNYSSIVDDWSFKKPLTDNALHLTYEIPPKGFKGAFVVDFDTAISGA